MVDFKSKPVPMPQLKIENKAVPMPKLKIKNTAVPMPEFPTKYRTLPKKDKQEAIRNSKTTPSQREFSQNMFDVATIGIGGVLKTPKIIRKGMQLVNRAVNAVSNKIEKQAIKSSLKVKKGELKSIGVRDRIIENRLPSQARANKLVKDFNQRYPTMGKVMKENLPNKEGRVLFNYRNHKSFYGSKEGLPATKQTFKQDMDRVRDAGDKALINNLNKDISPQAKVWKENKIYKDIGKELNKVRMDAAKASKESVNRITTRNTRLIKQTKNKVTVRKIKQTAPKVTGVAIGAGMATYAKNAELSKSKAPQPSYMKKVKNKEFLK